MELVDENLVIDLIEHQKLSYKQEGSVLKRDILVCVIFHHGPLEDFVAKGVYLQEYLLKKWLKWWW